MNTSQSIDALAAALATAQSEMVNPKFDKANPHFKSKYASLAAVRDAVVPVLSKHGLSVTQELTSVDGGVGCLTRVAHSSGQWMDYGPFVIPADKSNAQGYGSACTYARRFSMMAVAGVVGDDDDDGNEASHGEPKKAPAKPQDERESFPPTDGPIGKAAPPTASKAIAERATLEAMTLKQLCSQFARSYRDADEKPNMKEGATAVKAKVEELKGDFSLGADMSFGDPSIEPGLRAWLINCIMDAKP